MYSLVSKSFFSRPQRPKGRILTFEGKYNSIIVVFISLAPPLTLLGVLPYLRIADSALLDGSLLGRSLCLNPCPHACSLFWSWARRGHDRLDGQVLLHH